jgi:hypothetical protein
MPKSSKNTETAFDRAYKAYFDRDRPSIRSLAKEFGLNTEADYKRLHARINGRPPLTAKTYQ